MGPYEYVVESIAGDGEYYNNLLTDEHEPMANR